MTAIRDAGKPAAVSVTFRSRGAVTRRPVPSWVKVIKILGDTIAGDGTEYSYKRVASEPGHSDKLQSSDGAWWELVLDSDGPGSAVTTVNGYDGDVVLDADDIDDTSTTNKFATSAQLSKLDGVEDGATADQTGAEIAAAIDIENTAARSGFASGDKLLIWEDGVGNRQIDYDDLPGVGGGGAVTSVNSQTGVVVLDPDDLDDTSTTNKFTTAGDISKLAGIETGATADQTGPEIAALIDADDIDDSSTTNKFVDAALITKVSGIEAGAEVNRTNAELATDININGTTDAAAFGSGDKLLIYDASATANRRIDYDDLPGSGSFSASTGYTISGTTTSRSLLNRGLYEPINVLDYGADPTGSSSSTSAFNAAFADLRSYSPGTGQVGACLIIPPNRHASQTYVIDGNGVNATRMRGDGLCNVRAYGARILGDMNTGLPMIDTAHSQGFTWHGGTLIGDSTNPPRVGIQLTRIYTGPPTGSNTNPSSQGHYFQELSTAGHFTVAGWLNYGAEEVMAIRCAFENERDTTSSLAIVQNGMHDSDYLPTSAFENVAFGEFTGFANNVFVKCLFGHNPSGGGGPGVYLFRPSGHKYIGCLAQVRQDQPHFIMPHRAGVSTNAARDVEISGRYEDSGANSLIYFTGDAGGIYDNFKINVDRAFFQSLYMLDSSWSDGAGAALENFHARVSNVTPQAVSANPAGYFQVFRNKAKLAHYSGELIINQRSNAGTTYVDIRDFDIDQFNGTLKVSDRDEIPALPGGNFTLYDDTDVQPIEYATEITYTVQLKDTSGDTSSSTATAKTWREKDIQYVLFRDLNSISAAGMTSGDAIRVTLPVACADEDFVFGHIVATDLASEPTPTGNILGVRIDIGTGNNYATLRACDSGSATTALLTVANMTGANIREFYVGYRVV